MSASIDIEVKCEECGEEINAEWDRYRKVMMIHPCAYCMKKAAEKAEEMGYDRGLLEGQQSVTT